MNTGGSPKRSQSIRTWNRSETLTHHDSGIMPLFFASEMLPLLQIEQFGKFRLRPFSRHKEHAGVHRVELIHIQSFHASPGYLMG